MNQIKDLFVGTRVPVFDGLRDTFERDHSTFEFFLQLCGDNAIRLDYSPLGVQYGSQVVFLVLASLVLELCQTLFP